MLIIMLIELANHSPNVWLFDKHNNIPLIGNIIVFGGSYPKSLKTKSDKSILNRTTLYQCRLIFIIIYYKAPYYVQLGSMKYQYALEFMTECYITLLHCDLINISLCCDLHILKSYFVYHFMHLNCSRTQSSY